LSSPQVETTAHTENQLKRAQRLLGKNIRARREELALSQEELGHKINADQAYISRIERGLFNPTLESIVEISCALNFSLPK